MLVCGDIVCPPLLSAAVIKPDENQRGEERLYFISPFQVTVCG